MGALRNHDLRTAILSSCYGEQLRVGQGCAGTHKEVPPRILEIFMCSSNRAVEVAGAANIYPAAEILPPDRNPSWKGRHA
jgi:hypothetical protein